MNFLVGGWLCPAGWETDHAEGKCYQFSDDLLPYDEAKTACPDNSVLKVQSAEAQSFLNSLVIPALFLLFKINLVI